MSTRDDDLRKLAQIRDNRSLPVSERRAAAQAFEKVLEQSRNPELENLRIGLIKAKQANDIEWIQKYEEQIARMQ